MTDRTGDSDDEPTADDQPGPSELGDSREGGSTVVENGIRATYDKTSTERRLTFVAEGVDGASRRATTVTVAQNREGYAMLAVRGPDGEELERYYGFDMALDHAAELLGVVPSALPFPDVAADMGM